MLGQDTFHYKGLPHSQDDKMALEYTMALRSISRLEVTSPNKCHGTLVKYCKCREFFWYFLGWGLSLALFMDPVYRWATLYLFWSKCTITPIDMGPENLEFWRYFTHFSILHRTILQHMMKTYMAQKEAKYTPFWSRDFLLRLSIPSIRKTFCQWVG